MLRIIYMCVRCPVCWSRTRTKRVVSCTFHTLAMASAHILSTSEAFSIPSREYHRSDFRYDVDSQPIWNVWGVPAWKKRVSESLVESHTYNPIQDSWRDSLARLLVKLFTLKSLAKRHAESLGSDYMHDSWRDSPRDSFFYAGYL